MGKYRVLGSLLDRVFRNNLNANFDDVDADIQAQKKRVDDLIIANPSPSEVQDARLGFPVLRDKLVDVDEQLAENTTKLDHVIINVAKFPIQTPEVDDTARIKRAIDSLAENNTLFLPEINRWYNISDSITISKKINFICRGRIQFSGVRDRVALKFMDMTMCKIEIFKVFDQASVANEYAGYHGWENDAYTGVELDNLKQCEVRIDEVRGFTTGVRAKASRGQGFWFNHIHIKQISMARLFLELNSDGAGSWLNSNYFYDTSFYLSGDATIRTSTQLKYSIIQTMTNGNAYGGNSNYFYRQKYEVNTLYTGGMWTQIKLLKASGWIFRDYRVELSGASQKFLDIDMSKADGSSTSKGISSNDNKFFATDAGGNTNFSYATSFTNTLNINCSYPEIASLEPIKNYLVLHERDFKLRYRRFQDNYHTIKGLVRKSLISTSLTEETSWEYKTEDLLAENGIVINSGSPIVFYISNLSKGDTITIEKIHSSGTLYSNWYKPFDTLDVLCANGLIDGGKALGHYGYWDAVNNVWRQHAGTEVDTFTVNSTSIKTVAILVAGTLNGIKIYSTNKNTVVKKTMNPSIYKSDGVYVRSIPSRALNGYFMPEDVVYNENNATGQAIGWKLVNNAGVLSWQSIGTY
ncbi:hypothetical protein M3175_07770 [Robertmurraya korlensis]|uniref:hypothetical protein n=1 Tax=Robertmurraya korlensis TaxID=519977 RepID=UPI0020402DA0|nr:hypothetical protein [Robertmurraya korlensis]MCM3600625.1 hypothetical protein [Robertmurraya korlensis]